MVRICNLRVRQAVSVLMNGGVIAYPTESVFGLGCLPFYPDAVARILSMKRRAVKKGLICVAAETRQFEAYVDFAKTTYLQEIYQSWPGAVTWLVPAKSHVPYWLTGDHQTLAIRVSAHPLIKVLSGLLGPIVSTSANPQGAKPAYATQQVRNYFLSKLDYIYPGCLDDTVKPTTIRDACSGNIVRAA